MATLIAGAVGVPEPLPTLKTNPPWLLDDDHAVVAGLQSNVPATAPLNVTVQLEDCPGVPPGVLLPPQAAKAATSATKRVCIVPPLLYRVRLRGGWTQCDARLMSI